MQRADTTSSRVFARLPLGEGGRVSGRVRACVVECKRDCSASLSTPLTPTHSRRKREPNGFSLIELVMIIVIVGIVAAIAVPRYAQALSRYRVEASATRLTTDLRLAISRAKAGSASYVVAADLAGEKVSIAGPLPAVTVVANTDYTASPYLADLAVGGSASESVTIDGYGRPDRAITFTVISGNNQRTVTLTATGEVTSP